MSLPSPTSSAPFFVSTLTLEIPLPAPLHSPTYTDATGEAILSASTVLLTCYYPSAARSSNPHNGAADAVAPQQATGQPWLEPPKLKSITGLLKYAGIPKYLAPALVLPAWGVLGQKLPCDVDASPAPAPSSAASAVTTTRQDGQGAKWPTILFSHGLGGTRTTYSTLCIGLAAQGNVVVALEHRDGTAACTTTFPPAKDGSATAGGVWSWLTGSSSSSASISKAYVRPDELKGKPEAMDFRRAQLLHRHQEVEAALDVLRRLQAGEGPALVEACTRSRKDGESSPSSLARRKEAVTAFRGLLDMDNIWIAGHSFGAATAIEEVRRSDSPFKQALLLDPWIEPLNIDGSDALPFSRPIYTINSEHFTCWKSHMDDVLRMSKIGRKTSGKGWLCTLAAEPQTSLLSHENGAATIPTANVGVSTSKALDPTAPNTDPSRLVVVHDMFGTLFSLSALVSTLTSLFPNQLSTTNGTVPKILAELVVMDWFHATQRDFTYRSVAGGYTPIGSVFKATLPRVLLQAGILPQDGKDARVEAMSEGGAGLERNRDDRAYENPYGEEVVNAMMSALKQLQPRPGMVEALTRVYRDRGGDETGSSSLHPSISKVDVWAATNGSLDLGRSSFLRVLGEVDGNDLDLDTGSLSSQFSKRDRDLGTGVGLISCDEISVAKPDLRVYQEILRRTHKQPGDTGLWFVASHTWDLFAAREAGFKTAWVSYEEFFPCQDIFGRPDVIATDMEDCARQILAHERRTREERGEPRVQGWRYADEEEQRERPLASRHTAFSDFPFLKPGGSFDGSVSSEETIRVIVELCDGLIKGKGDVGREAAGWRIWREGRPIPNGKVAEAMDGKKKGRIVFHDLC